jgi:lipopolysaccharide export system permease protein
MYDYTKERGTRWQDWKMPEKNTKFSFDLEDLTPVIYIAETLSLDKLYEFIDKEKRGSSNINIYGGFI